MLHKFTQDESNLICFYIPLHLNLSIYYTSVRTLKHKFYQIFTNYNFNNQIKRKPITVFLTVIPTVRYG